MLPSRLARALLALVLLAAGPADVAAQSLNFVNFESGHVRPLALAPDGTRLLAVNTPDNRLAIYDVGPGTLTLAGEVRVGLEPVAVAARVHGATGALEAWVVNHLSDSVSVVEVDPANPALARVTRTLWVGDEPRDVVFAGPAGDRAFVTTARRGQNVPASVPPLVSEEGVPRALVWAFDADDPGGGPGGTPLAVIELFSDTPRALAASPDGATVYAAAFHSGNRTTTIAQTVVAANGGSPPPPPGSAPSPPAVGLIVRFDPAAGRWEDELARDWSPFVMFSLPDRDVFVIDASGPIPALAAPPNAAVGVGTILFNMAVHPVTGDVYVSNTEARNEVRFENFLAGDAGVQGHVAESRITIVSGTTPTPVHLNTHVDYGVPTGPPEEIAASVAFPTDLVFSSDGTTLYAAALGSDVVAVYDSAALAAGDGAAADRIAVGGGPSGLALDESRDQLFVMHRFDHTIAIVTAVSNPAARAVAGTASLRFDPSPPPARDGRRFLYDARFSSGHGDAACASCHVFGDFDSLAWDLGDPQGVAKPNLNPFVGGGTPSVALHPLKGPMTTQSLRGMADMGPMHWRGDRTGADTGGDPLDEELAFTAFNAAFPGLLGRAAELAPDDMQAFTDFILTVRYPPNPIRALDDQPTSEEALGELLFTAVPFDGVACDVCHTLPFGADGLSTREGAVSQDFKVPHLRNVYQKVGMFGVPPGIFNIPPTGFLGEQVRGFGMLHDGSIASSFNFIQAFDFEVFTLGDPERRAVEAFQLALDTGLKPAVGQQLSVTPASFPAPGVVDPAALARRDLLVDRADAGDCDLVMQVVALGEARGVLYVGGDLFATDRAADPPIDKDALLGFAQIPGLEQLYTCVSPGTGIRIGVDRDEDGLRDHDEIDLGLDPAGPWSVIPTCTTGTIEGLAKPQVRASRLLFPPGEQKITVRGEWVLPLPVSPALDPAVYGFNLRVIGADAATLLMRSVPPGLRADNGEPGWKVNKKGDRWDFKDKDGVLAGGITRVTIIDKSKTFPGLVKVRAKGKGLAMQVAESQIPVELVLVPGGGQQSASAQCATRTFNPPAGEKPRCRLRSNGNTLSCS